MHECPSKSLRAIIFCDDEKISINAKVEFAKVAVEVPKVTITNEAHFSNIELSVYSFGGISSLKTMKLRAWV